MLERKKNRWIQKYGGKNNPSHRFS